MMDRFEAARAYVHRAAFAVLLAGIPIHVRILAAAPLTSSRPFLWMVLATLENVATAAAGAAILSLLVVPRSPRLARVLATVFALLHVALQAGLAESTIFFGHGLYRENLQVALHPRFFAGSMGGHTLGWILFFTGLTALLLAAAHFSLRFRPKRWSEVLVCGVAVAAIASANLMPAIDQADATSDPVWTVVTLLNHGALRQVKRKLLVLPPQGKTADIRLLMPRRHNQFLSDEYPLAYLPPLRSPDAPRLNVRPNIVFWMMEGFRAEEVDAYGGPIPNLTPNFDRLAPQSLFFQNAYSTGSYTPEGELAMWYGLQASPYEMLMRTRPYLKLYGLPDVLAKDGYQLLWMDPVDADMYLGTRFYLNHGFRVIDGRSFNPSLARTSWGYSDRALAQTLVGAMDRMQQPFAAMGVTVSNHHPFHVPDDAVTRLSLPETRPQHGFRDLVPGLAEGEHTLPRLHTIHYADEALGYFIALARSRSWFKNTIFVIVGDHGAPTKPYHRSIESVHDYIVLRHKVAMLIYSPLLAPRVIKEPVSHVDVMPTLLGLLGEEGPRAGLGIDLLDPADADDQHMTVSWNDAHLMLLNDSHYSYHALLHLAGDRYVIHSEGLYAAGDQRGRNDIAAAHPGEFARFHRAATAYVDTYAWITGEGHSGIPPR